MTTNRIELEQLSQSQFDRFCAFIYRVSGIRIGENKRVLLSNRIRRRVPKGDDFDSYYRFLTSPRGAAEVEHFLDAVTTNETFFFRTPSHFQWLESEFIDELVDAERRGERPRSLRIWSAACATGAEPYSIAICLREQMHRLRDWDVTILGTDISTEALRVAREGTFNARAVEAVTPGQLRRFFVRGDRDGSWRVRPEIRELARFEQHNLLTPIAADPFDCVFIRNVLIYFDEASKRTVIGTLEKAVAPGGSLVVGPSEGIYGMLDAFERQTPFLYRKPRRS